MLGGSVGLKDFGLLESALAQPQATFFGEYLHPDIASQAAAYLFHIAKNHAFEDGNKRTAVSVMAAFLFMNDVEHNFNDDELYELVLNLTTDVITKQEATRIIQSKII
jgi:death-on-curing protein